MRGGRWAAGGGATQPHHRCPGTGKSIVTAVRATATCLEDAAQRRGAKAEHRHLQPRLAQRTARHLRHGCRHCGTAGVLLQSTNRKAAWQRSSGGANCGKRRELAHGGVCFCKRSQGWTTRDGGQCARPGSAQRAWRWAARVAADVAAAEPPSMHCHQPPSRQQRQRRLPVWQISMIQ